MVLLLLVLPTNSVQAEQLDFGDNLMGRVDMEGAKIDDDILKLSINTEDMVAPVLGMAFHLIYQSEDLAFLKYQPGDFLERGGDPFYLVSQNNGKLIFGQTLRRDDQFPLGGGRVVDFYFQILKESDVMGFSFENGVVSTLDTIRQDLSNIAWEDYFWEGDQNNVDYIIDKTGGDNAFVQTDNGQLFILISMVITALMAAYFLIKNMGKKRPDSYVNFK